MVKPSMIRSLTIKFVLLAGTLGFVMALNWPVEDRGVETLRIASQPSVPVSLAEASISSALDRKVEHTVKLPDQPKLVEFNSHGSKTNAIDLNLSTAQELEALPGIGPTLAKRIIDHRMQVGAFQSIQALEQVKGIGKKKLQALRPLLKISPYVVAKKSQG